jgi:hypothetical protein
MLVAKQHCCGGKTICAENHFCGEKIVLWRKTIFVAENIFVVKTPFVAKNNLCGEKTFVWQQKPFCGEKTINNNNKQKGRVCRFSSWPTAGFCLTHAHTRIDTCVRHVEKTTNRSETGPCPSDLDGVGCSRNRKTCPVHLVMALQPEKVE